MDLGYILRLRASVWDYLFQQWTQEYYSKKARWEQNSKNIEDVM